MAKVKKKEVLSLEEKLEQALVPVEEWPYEVPKNWCWVRLKNVTYHISDGLHNLPKDAGKGIPLLSATNIHDSQVDFKNVTRYITEEEWEQENKRTKVAVGDVLLTIVASIGRTAIIENDIKFALQRSVAVIKPIYNGKYIKYFLDSPYIQNFMLKNAKGTAQKGFYLKSVEELCIAFPPVFEQQRIVEQIESLFSKLDEAKENLLNVINSFSERKSVILNKAFKGELTAVWRERNGVSIENWEHKKFSDLCNIVRGGSPRPAGSPEFYDGTIPFMKVADITGNRGPYVSKTEHTIKEAGLRKTRMVEANTLLLTNSGATLGVPAITTIQTTFNDGIAAFLDLKEESLLFYYYFWMSKISELRAINKGAAQPNLNTTIIGEMEIDVPSIAEQQEIVKILQNLIEKEENVKEIAENMVEQISLMKKSILAKAFRGELGTNNPDEEKAIELLKQIIKE